MSRYPTLIASWLSILFPVWVILGNAAQDIAMSTVAVLFLLHSYMTRDWQWCKQPWIRCMGLLWVYMIVRGGIADYNLYATDKATFDEHSFEALRRGLPFGRYFVFAAALAFWTLRDAEPRRKFFGVLAGVVLLLAADCTLQWFAGKDIVGRKIILDPAGHLRLTGPYKSPMPGIILAWLSFLAFLPMLITAQGKLKSGGDVLKGGAYCLFVLAAIAFTGERLALLITLAGWVLAILLLPNKRALLGVFAGGVVVLAVVAFTNPLVLSRQVQSTIHTFADWKHSPYGQLLDTDFKLAAQHPIFGGGTNYFRLDCPKLYPGLSKGALNGVCNIHPHNIYMEWLIDNGVIGFALFVAFLCFAIRECLRAWPRERTNPYFIGCIIAFIMRIWPFASSTNFASPFGAPPFWLVFGALLACTVVARPPSSAAATHKNQDSGA